MKFGKEYASQMVHEWQEAYMDYNSLKNELKKILKFKKKNAPLPQVAVTPKGSLRKRLSMYRAFSGLQNSFKSSPRKNNEDEVIVVNSEGDFETTFFVSCEEGGECELVFFRRLDDEFNKVLTFYQEKVREVKVEADKLSIQMEALIALRIKVDKPSIGMHTAQVMDPSSNDNSSTLSPASVDPIHLTSPNRPEMEAIQEVEMNSEEILEEKATRRERDKSKMNPMGFRPAPLEILDYVKINVEPETPVSTLRNCCMTSTSELSFSKEELRKAEEQMRKAFVEFYQKLRLLKSYRFLNMLAFSKIMKKYDKITSRKASKSYSDMIEKSYLGSSDEVSKLTERVEVTFINHFVNGNRRKGMKVLRPQAKRETHRVTFFMGNYASLLASTSSSYVIRGQKEDLGWILPVQLNHCSV